jgi:hypothetical protein
MIPILACTLTWGLLQGGGALVDRLKDFRQERETVVVLLSLDVEAYIVDLEQALRGDAGFASGTNARLAAYRVLAQERSIETIETREFERVINESQLTLLREGLADADYNIRAECVSSIPHWRSNTRGDAVVRLRQALLDPMPVVRIRACEAATSMPTEARSCLPELEKLLRDEIAPDQRFSWEQPIGPIGEMENYSLRGRASAARARVSVAGFAHDHKMYPSLDPLGRAALALAWSDYFGGASVEQLQFDPSRSRLCDAVVVVRAHEAIALDVLSPDHFAQLSDLESHSLFEGLSFACSQRIFTATTEDQVNVAASALTGNAGLSDAERTWAAELAAMIEGF